MVICNGISPISRQTNMFQLSEWCPAPIFCTMAGLDVKDVRPGRWCMVTPIQEMGVSINGVHQ